MILRRGALVSNPYEGILLERASFHGKVWWLVYWFYMSEETGGFSPSEIINVPSRKFVLEGDVVVGTLLSDLEKFDYVDRIKSGCVSSLRWVEEERVKSWVE